MTASSARERNALRVLDFLWRDGPASREELARGTELSRATVSKLVGGLIARGVIAERREPAAEPRGVPRSSGEGRFGPGRPPTLLALRSELGAFGGIDFGHGSVRVALADLAGTPIAETRYELDVDHEAERAIGLAVSGLEALAAHNGGPPARLVGVGAAISGPVRRDSGALAAAGILPGWGSISPRAELQRRLGVPVHVGNDADLGALAEVRSGAARGASDVVYLMLSSGVGGGLVLGGALFPGRSGITGELGHIPVRAGGEPCRCGNRGCLETVAGAQRLLAALRETLGAEVTLSEAADRARGGDERCAALFREAGLAAGRVVGAVCNLLNPELVIVGGELIVAGRLLVDAVREGLQQTAIAAVRADAHVVAASLGDRAELLGAIGLAIAQAEIESIVAV